MLFIYLGCVLCVAFCTPGVSFGRVSAEAGVGFTPGPPQRMWAPGAHEGRASAPALQGLGLHLSKSQRPQDARVFLPRRAYSVGKTGPNPGTWFPPRQIPEPVSGWLVAFFGRWRRAKRGAG